MSFFLHPEKGLFEIEPGSDFRQGLSMPRARILKAVSIFLPIMLVSLVVTALILYTTKQAEITARKFAQQHTVAMQVSGINHDIADIAATLQVLVNSDIVKNLWDASGQPLAHRVDALSEEFLNVARYYKSFNQVRLLDENGMETVRINYAGGVTEQVVQTKLQNKKGRYYFDDAFKIRRGQVFVSPLDLNVERGQIERPLKPMIRFASPAFDRWGNKRGVVLLNYFGAELIARFSEHESTLAGSQAMLLNADGFWLKGPVAGDEWGFMYPDRQHKTFGAKYPDAWQKMLSGQGEQFETDAGLFTFKSVSPLKAGQVSPYQAEVLAHTLPARSQYDAYRWRVVSFVPNTVLYADHIARLQLAAWLLGIFGLVVLVVAWRIAGIAMREKRIEQKLQVHYSALNAAGDAVLITDHDGNIEWINQALIDLSGYSPADLMSRDIGRLLDFEPQNRNEIEEAIAQNKKWQGELIYVHQNNHHVYTHTSLTPVADEKGRVKNFIAIMRDLSEKKAMETQLLAAQKMESIGQLAAGIAHEINTPTQFVGDNVHFLQDVIGDNLSVLHSLKALEQQLANKQLTLQEVLPVVRDLLQRADLEYIAEEAPQAIAQSLEGLGRIAKIVSAMKDFSHPGAEGKEELDLNHVVETTATIARNEWKYVASLETELDDNLPKVFADSQLLGQTILNFIVNASHAIADRYGEGEKKGLIRVATRLIDDRVELRIADNGTGIREEIRERIFEPFFTTKHVGKGSGQGLAIAYSAIVEKHQGAIDIESKLGEGTTFIITLPVKNDTEEERQSV